MPQDIEPEQNDWYFLADIFKCIFLNKNHGINIQLPHDSIAKDSFD